MNRKSHAQNLKTCILYNYWEYLLCPQSNASGNFLQTCINSVEQRLKFSHFEGSVIPQVITYVDYFFFWSYEYSIHFMIFILKYLYWFYYSIIYFLCNFFCSIQRIHDLSNFGFSILSDVFSTRTVQVLLLIFKTFA